MKQKNWIVILMSALLSLCLAFLGLLGALELTLFNSGYLIQCMDKSDYIGEITNVIRSTCQGYASAAGLNALVLDGYIEQEEVLIEVQRSIAERYRGSEGAFYQNHFTGFGDSLIAALSSEESAIETETSLARFNLLQILCERTFQEVTRPPFDSALSTVLQYYAYRLWAYLVLTVLISAICLVLHRAVSEKNAFLYNVMQALMGAAPAVIIMSALVRWAMPYQTWMPAQNLAYSLFCTWWKGFSTALISIGLLMLAAVLLWAFWQRYSAAAGKAKPAAAVPAVQPAADSGDARTLNISRAVKHRSDGSDRPDGSDGSNEAE